MSRVSRIALLGGAVLILAVAGTVLATRQQPRASEPAGVTQDQESPPTAEDLAHAAERLEEKGLDASMLDDLAAEYGIGGAVRLIAWSSDPDIGMTLDQLRQKRDTGGPDGGPLGWGRIAKELGVHPGIGSIMGSGGGNGRENAPGQQNDEAP
jgi:hypothetical protein